MHNSNRRTISNLLERSRGILDSMVEGREPEEKEWLQMLNTERSLIVLTHLFFANTYRLEIIKFSNARFSEKNINFKGY